MAEQKGAGSGTIISPQELQRLTAKGYKVKSLPMPNPIQNKILWSKADVILAAGAKGWGKSFAAQLFLLMGDFYSPHRNGDFNRDPLARVARSYVYHEHYLAGLVRRNEKDLASFVMDMMPKAKALGLTYIKSPAMFVHKETGAQILLGHAADKDAWMKWQGMNLIRLVVEEAGQIPDFSAFEQLRSCMRSVYPEMKAQMLLTANPGGPGQGWLMDYFIEPKTMDRRGEFTGDPLINPNTNQPYVAGEEIEERIENPWEPGKFETIRRVWITGTLKDNPHAMKSKYIYNLASITDEKLRKMYIYGDWRAGSGSYFGDIFSKTHHICPQQELPGWWKSSASLDWGLAHESAVYWAKKDPSTKQTIIYKELVVSRTDPLELGAELARQSKPELDWQETITFYISHDAFHNRLGDLTVAELLMKGASKVVGRNAVFSPDAIIKRLKEKADDNGSLWDINIEEALKKERRKGINFVMAPKSRAVGWLLMRSMMRVNPIVRPDQMNMEMYLKLLIEDGLDKATTYAHMFPQPEILPQLLIMDGCCPRLVAAIPKAIHDEKNPEDIDKTHFHGMDSLDSCRYLLGGLRDEPPSTAPYDIQEQKMLERAYRRDPNLSVNALVHIRDHFRQTWEEDQPKLLPTSISLSGCDHTLDSIDI